jgi:hypothetical protein
VNRLFAQALAPLLRDDDLVWVHDYHLIPLAAELRAMAAASASASSCTSRCRRRPSSPPCRPRVADALRCSRTT